MAVTRPLKEGSVTTYQQKVALGFPDILASEMDADLDTIYAAWNGGVATANLIDGAVTTAKLAPNLQTWQTGAGNPITPIDATKRVVIPGPTTAETTDQAVLNLGQRTMKGRVNILPGTDHVGMSLNRRFDGTAWQRDDTGKSAWQWYFDGIGNTFSIAYSSPAGVGQTQLQVDSAGRLLLPNAPGTGTVVVGATNQTTRLIAPGILSANAFFSGSWQEDDPTKTGWLVQANAPSDVCVIQRMPASNGALATLITFDNSGNIILAGPTGQKSTGTTWSNPSDRRLKDDITDYTIGLSVITALVPRTFIYNGKGGSQAGVRGYGYIADEVEPVMPEMVGVTKAKLNADDEEDTDIQTLDTSNVTLALINAMKELAMRVAALETPGARLGPSI